MARHYLCTICDKAFGHVRTLRAHMTTHTAEKPFECTVCGKRYAQADILKNHMKVVHSDVVLVVTLTNKLG